MKKRPVLHWLWPVVQAPSIGLIVPFAVIIAVGDKQDFSVGGQSHNIAIRAWRYFRKRICIVGHGKDASRLTFELVLHYEVVVDVSNTAYRHVSLTLISLMF